MCSLSRSILGIWHGSSFLECAIIRVTGTKCGWADLDDSIGGDDATTIFAKLSPRGILVFDGILDSRVYLCNLWCLGLLVSQSRIQSLWLEFGEITVMRWCSQMSFVANFCIYFVWYATCIVGETMPFSVHWAIVAGPRWPQQHPIISASYYCA